MYARRSITLVSTLVAISSLLLSACLNVPGPGDATQSPACAPATGARTYVLVPKEQPNPYFDMANTGAQAAAKELGVTVLYQGAGTPDASQQIQVVNSLIAQKVTGLAISADDAKALVPAGQSAMAACIPVVSWDSAIAKGGAQIYVNAASTQGIGDVQVKMASDLAGPDGGQIAILSTTPTAAAPNSWITVIKADLQKPENSKLNLVDVVYDNDDDATSYQQTQALITKYPDLKVIIALTPVGTIAAARAVKDGNLTGKVFVTGLGNPDGMRPYVKAGVAPEFALWNPVDLGYLAIYTLDALATGKIKGQPGESFSAGRLGSYTLVESPVGAMVLIGPPTIFNKDNIDNFHF